MLKQHVRTRLAYNDCYSIDMQDTEYWDEKNECWYYEIGTRCYVLLDTATWKSHEETIKISKDLVEIVDLYKELSKEV